MTMFSDAPMFRYPCGCIGLGYPPPLTSDDKSPAYENVLVVEHCDNDGYSSPQVLGVRTLRGPARGERGASMLVAGGGHDRVAAYLRRLLDNDNDMATLAGAVAPLRRLFGVGQ